MVHLNSILKGANVYSIEYTGYLIFKISISNNAKLYEDVESINIEFISGCTIVKENSPLPLHTAFQLYGLDISEATLDLNKMLKIQFENGVVVSSLASEDDLYDRCWELKIIGKINGSIVNDTVDIFVSESIKTIIG